MGDDPKTDEARETGLRKISDAWIFVSHSHQDLGAVRRVRDELEQLHANPLLFFLLCLEKDEELDWLIKREITARNFFLLCNSPLARTSSWVQREREFVQSLDNQDRKRKIYELDLQWPWPRQQRIIREALGAATTFLSYSSHDTERVQPYIDFLVRNDFAVFNWRESPSFGDEVAEQLGSAIERSVNGYFIVFLSAHWLNSRWAAAEISRYLALAKDRKDSRPPIFIALEPNLPQQLPPHFQALQILDFSRGDLTDHERQLLQLVGLRDRDDAR
jgi:hypothetical protein